MASKSAIIKVSILGDERDYKRALGNAESETSSFMGRIQTGFGKGGAFLAGIGLGIGNAVFNGISRGFDMGVDYIGGAIGNASDLNENLSKISTVFDDSAPEVTEWARGANAIGLSDVAATQALGTFGNLFDMLGYGSDENAKYSKSLLTMAADQASFHNADITDVLNAQNSALRGEYDSFQRFNPLLTDAAVKQKALEMTGKATNDELTEQEVIAARLELILGDTSAATGDFARTSEDAANKSRIISSRFEDLQTRIGTGLLPVWEGLLDFVDQKFLPAAEGVVDWAGDVKAAFDEGGLAGAFEFIKGAWGNFTTWITDDFWPNTLQPAIVFAWEKTKEKLGEFGIWLKDDFWPNTLQPALASSWGAIGTWLVETGLPWFEEKVPAFMHGMADWITNKLVPTIQDAFDHVVNAFVNWISGGEDSNRNASKEMGEKLPTIREQIVDFIKHDLAPSLIWASAAIVGAVGTGILDLMTHATTTIISKIPAIVNGIWDALDRAFVGIGSWLWEEGKDLVKGFIDGILSIDVWKFVKDHFNIAPRVSDMLGIFSPSKVFMELGAFTMEGFVQGFEGITTEIPRINSAVGEVVQAAAPSGRGGGIGGPQIVVNFSSAIPYNERTVGREIKKALREYERATG